MLEQYADAIAAYKKAIALNPDDALTYLNIGKAAARFGLHAEAIASYTGVQVEPQMIMLTGPIKEIGQHEVTVKPHPEVQFQLTLDVIPA